MKYISYILIISISLTPLSIWGQNNKMEEIKRRTENKIDYRVDRHIDRQIDKGLDKIEGLFRRKKKKNTGNSPSNTDNSRDKKVSESNGNETNISATPDNQKKIEFSEKYEFESELVMEMQLISNSKKKEEKMIFTYLFPKQDENFFGCKMRDPSDHEIEQNMTIIQPEEMITFLDSDGGKYYNVIDLSSVSEELDEDEDMSKKLENFKKTGRTKDILGYRCEEYVYEDENSLVNFWASMELKQLGKQMMTVLTSMSKSMNKNNNMSLSDVFPVDGMMLEVISYDKESKEKIILTSIELNLQKSVYFDPSPYKPLDINSMMKGN
ncbi:MAG: DUF4412 domain-containing protein [Saprospiraceae bacterium]|nr:DUF4412 domain-containing protein [Saprospiraceae bacterium]